MDRFLAIDCETSGLDHFHGCRPFLVTTCDQDGEQQCWEWNVDPLTREVQVLPEDVEEIRGVIDDAPLLVGHNIRFDARALRMIGVVQEWPWYKTEDTVVAAHLLNSSVDHDLSNTVNRYVDGVSIWSFEDKLGEAVKSARRWVSHHRKDWRQAKDGDPMLPSSREMWRSDYWLPRACYLNDEEVRTAHPEWESVLRNYANADSAATAMLWPVMRSLMAKSGRMPWYRSRMTALPAFQDMEDRGPTVSEKGLTDLEDEYRASIYTSESVMVNLAKRDGYELNLPKGAVNKSLTEYMFGVMKLPVAVETEKGNPSLNAAALEAYTVGECYLDDDRQRLFCSHLASTRKRQTALTYMAAYRRFGLDFGEKGYWKVHPSFNQTGTSTTRASSSNPNGQNVSKKEDFNLRRAFGPSPGREWVSIDYQNLELRIPAYESGEEKMILLFEQPDEPPYFGSYHALNASIVHPELFRRTADVRDGFKKANPEVYKTVKNGGFAMQYGAQRQKTDATFRVKGAYDLLDSQLPKVAALRNKYTALGNRHGFVETIPDKEIDPKHGYPMHLVRHNGRVSPTEPFSYHIQGTAGHAKNKALVRVHDELVRWRQDGCDGWIILEVHDELVFDLPAGTCETEPFRVRRLVESMELSGTDIGIPLTVSPSFHPKTWAADEEFPAEY